MEHVLQRAGLEGVANRKVQILRETLGLGAGRVIEMAANTHPRHEIQRRTVADVANADRRPGLVANPERWLVKEDEHRHGGNGCLTPHLFDELFRSTGLECQVAVDEAAQLAAEAAATFERVGIPPLLARALAVGATRAEAPAQP